MYSCRIRVVTTFCPTQEACAKSFRSRGSRLAPRCMYKAMPIHIFLAKVISALNGITPWIQIWSTVHYNRRGTFVLEGTNI